jgi:lipopolysaccharide export system permease protein
MGILFWYILRHYLKILVMCLTGLTSIYLIIDFFEKLRRFLRHDAELSSMLMYFFFKIPDISFKLAPFATLMAALLAIGLLNKNHEITAMRSCGFSLLHIAAPFLSVAALATVVLFGFTAVLIPLGNAQAERIKTVEIQKKPQPLAFTAENLWLRIQNNTIMNVKEISPEGDQLRSIHLYRMDPSFQLNQLLSAETVDYSTDGWSLKNVIQRNMSSNGPVTVSQFEQLPLQLSLTPEDLRTWISLEPEHMPLGQLWEHIQHLKKEGHNITGFLTDYWGRIAFSFVTLIMTILGVSLGLLGLGSRTSSVAKNIGQALGISFLFWTTHSVGIALGRSGALMPIIAGWIACIMFLSVSLNFFLKVRY